MPPGGFPQGHPQNPGSPQSQESRGPMMRMGPGGGGGHGPMGMGRQIEKPKDTKKVLKRLVRYLSHNVGIILIIFALSGLAAFISIYATRISGSIVDNFIMTRDASGLLAVCGLLLGIYLVSVVSSYIQERLMVWLSQNTTALMRKDLFGKMIRLPLDYFDKHSSGDLMSRLTNDVDTIGMTISQNVTSLFSGVINVIGTLIAMLLLSPMLTLITVAIVPVMLVITRGVAKISRKLFKRQAMELGALNGYIEEIISGQKVVKLFSREQKVREGFSELNLKLKKSSTMAQCVAGVMGPAMNFINNVSYLMVAVAGGYMVVSSGALGGGVTVGTVFAFLQYKRQFSNPLNQLANLFNTIQSALAAAERVFEVMDQRPEADAPGAAELTEVKGGIELADVTFSYIPGISVLKKAGVSAVPGEQVAIVGPTGSGKTTIISLLMRFYDPDSGTIRLDGTDVTRVTRDSLRKNVGMVLQDTYLFSETVRANIRYGAPGATDEQVEAAAKISNAHQFIIHLPDGYDTVLADNGGNLSQGQRQLLAIARAILAGPQVLILDEATSSVDTRTEINIQQALLKLMEGRTCFIIAHRLSTIRGADKILVVHDGEIVESGTHEQLLVKPEGFYAHLYNMQYTTGMAI